MFQNTVSNDKWTDLGDLKSRKICNPIYIYIYIYIYMYMYVYRYIDIYIRN